MWMKSKGRIGIVDRKRMRRIVRVASDQKGPPMRPVVPEISLHRLEVGPGDVIGSCDDK